MSPIDPRRVWATIWADLRQLSRQRSAWFILVVLILTGIGMAVASARIELAVVLPISQSAFGDDDDDDNDAPEALPLCVPGPTPRVVVDGPLPDYITVPGTAVQEGDPDAVAGVKWVPDPTHPERDGELLYWAEPGGSKDDRTFLVDCLRTQIIDARDRRLEALGITFRSFNVLRLKRHDPPAAAPSRWMPKLRWLQTDLPAGLDLFEVMAALLAMMLGSGQVVDGILRNRTSGWEETLGLSGLPGRERLLAQLGASALLSCIVMVAVCIGGLLAGPFVGWMVHPGRLLVAALTPLACTTVLVVATRSAPDVRAGTARVVFPFALLLYAVMGGLMADLPWLPIGGPVVLAALGGTAWDWTVGILTTVLPMLALVGWAMHTAPHIRTNHGDRQSAGPRHARGEFAPEALLLCGLGFWAIVILPLVASANMVAAHLLGQLGGLALAALVAPRALGLPVARTLALVRPTGRGVASAVLLPLGTLPMMMVLFHLQSFIPGLGPAVDQTMNRFAETQIMPLAVPLGGALIWAVPALAEELFFRGAVLGLLLPRGPWRRGWRRTAVAVVVQAVAFGLLHMLAARWIPTAALGLVIGILAVRTRSVVPGIIAHAVHNFGSVWLPQLTGDTGMPEPWILALASVWVVPALWLASPAPTGDNPEDGPGPS